MEFSWMQGWVSRGRHGISWLWVSWVAWLVATGRRRVGIVWVGYLHHCHLVDRVGQSHAYLQPALCKQLSAKAARKPATAPVTQPTFPEMKGSLGRDCSSMRPPTKVVPLTNPALPSYFLLQAGPSNKMMRHPLNQPWVLGVGVVQTKPGSRSAERKVCNSNTLVTSTSFHQMLASLNSKKVGFEKCFQGPSNLIG